mmetsp:Transcript_30746/g.45074  ORF Transcript_30746/g.45074 Transcript_30746/m.45074 type:complete len:230 (+) Transcript_30746:393-1082(+)
MSHVIYGKKMAGPRAPSSVAAQCTHRIPTCPATTRNFFSACRFFTSSSVARNTSRLRRTKQSRSLNHSRSSGTLSNILLLPSLVVMDDVEAETVSPSSAEDEAFLSLAAAAAFFLTSSCKRRHMRRKNTFCEPRGNLAICSRCDFFKDTTVSRTAGGHLRHFIKCTGISVKLLARRSTLDQKNFLPSVLPAQWRHCMPAKPLGMLSRLRPLALRSASVNLHGLNWSIKK